MGQAGVRQPMQYSLLSEEELAAFSDAGPHTTEVDWVVGHRYVVMDRDCVLRATPEACGAAASSSSSSGPLPRGMVVLLLALREEQGSLWGLLEPPAVGGLRRPLAELPPLVSGWALLSGCGSAERQPLRSLGAAWEVGCTYWARTGTVARREADLTSEALRTLAQDEVVELLELSSSSVGHDGEGEGGGGDEGSRPSPLQPRLRAKVQLQSCGLVCWVSPKNEAGQHILLPHDGESFPRSGWRRCRMPAMFRSSSR